MLKKHLHIWARDWKNEWVPKEWKKNTCWFFGSQSLILRKHLVFFISFCRLQTSSTNLHNLKCMKPAIGDQTSITRLTATSLFWWHEDQTPSNTPWNHLSNSFGGPPKGKESSIRIHFQDLLLLVLEKVYLYVYIYIYIHMIFNISDRYTSVPTVLWLRTPWTGRTPDGLFHPTLESTSEKLWAKILRSAQQKTCQISASKK